MYGLKKKKGDARHRHRRLLHACNATTTHAPAGVHEKRALRVYDPRSLIDTVTPLRTVDARDDPTRTAHSTTVYSAVYTVLYSGDMLVACTCMYITTVQ